MERIDRLIHEVGHLAGSVSAGFQDVHRRMDTQDRTAAEWRRHFMTQIHHVDRKRRNGNGGPQIPYAKIATILGLIILGALGHIAPEAVRSAISKILLSQVGAG